MHTSRWFAAPSLRCSSACTVSPAAAPVRGPLLQPALPLEGVVAVVVAGKLVAAEQLADSIVATDAAAEAGGAAVTTAAHVVLRRVGVGVWGGGRVGAHPLAVLGRLAARSATVAAATAAARWGVSPVGLCGGLCGLSLEPLELLAEHSQLLGRVHGSGRRGWGPVGAPASPRGGGLLPRAIFGLCGPYVLVSVGSALRRGFAHIVGRTEGRRGGLLPEKVAGPAQSSLCVMPLELGRARKGHAQARANNWEVHS